MALDNKRRIVLRGVIGAAIAAATPISFLRAATRKNIGPIPPRTVLELADGKRIEIISKGDALVGRVLDSSGRLINTTPVGKLTLKSGKAIVFDKSGRLIQGQISERSFLLECDPPPAKCPP